LDDHCRPEQLDPSDHEPGRSEDDPERDERASSFRVGIRASSAMITCMSLSIA
jgi:hypothetical protein